MGKRKASDAPLLPLSVLEKHAQELRHLAKAHEELAKWAEAEGIDNLPETSVITAQLGLSYMWSFLGSVVKSYGSKIGQGGLSSVPLTEESRKAVFRAVTEPKAARTPKAVSAERDLKELSGVEEHGPVKKRGGK